MPREKRSWVSQEIGCYHLISRTARDNIKFTNREKEYFLTLLKCFSKGFFVDIHAFCIMGTHFHILATGLENEAEAADDKELLQRYKSIYGKKAEPPTGSFKSYGEFVVDEDYGISRLRKRLGSVSRFVQELKQTFSLWYNKQHSRKGYLWNDRFKGIIIENGDAQLSCSAYIDLNPVRAGIVKLPENYRWSSIGLMARDKNTSKDFLNLDFYSIFKNSDHLPDDQNTFANNKTELLRRYKMFVYLSGGVDKQNKGKIDQEVVDEVMNCHGRMGIGNSFCYRVRNMSEGIAIGTEGFIADIQQKLGRKFIKPRRFTKGNRFFTTRVLRI